MTIINHGSWTSYKPDVWPEGAPKNAMFCKRGSDGIDWYDYINNGASFAPGSIKVTVTEGLTRAVYRDESMLFPQGSIVLEITGDNVADPHNVYAGLVYDEATNTLSPPTPPPAPDALDTWDIISLKIAFNHENRLRALENKAPITLSQFKTAVKALL